MRMLLLVVVHILQDILADDVDGLSVAAPVICYRVMVFVFFLDVEV